MITFESYPVFRHRINWRRRVARHLAARRAYGWTLLRGGVFARPAWPWQTQGTALVD